MTHSAQIERCARATRRLLRKLRDVNLGAQRVAIRPDLTVSFAGCLTLDAPVEMGVRYLLRGKHDERQTLTLKADGIDLDICLQTDEGELHLCAPMGLDEKGRAVSEAISARISVEEGERRDYERFLRRVIRGVYAA